jgi:hypothetical protein
MNRFGSLGPKFEPLEHEVGEVDPEGLAPVHNEGDDITGTWSDCCPFAVALISSTFSVYDAPSLSFATLLNIILRCFNVLKFFINSVKNFGSSSSP